MSITFALDQHLLLNFLSILIASILSSKIIIFINQKFFWVKFLIVIKIPNYRLLKNSSFALLKMVLSFPN
jgi:hypothetical protein